MDDFLTACVRPASLQDLPHAYAAQHYAALKALYDAEWRRRGFKRAP